MPVIEPELPGLSSLETDDAIRQATLRKASWRLIPLIALGYGTAYIDRVNISFASLQMNRNLHFSASVYGLGAGLFFLSYAACEIPSNLLLYRFGARRWIARIMFTWGLLAIGMMFVKTPAQFYVMRFLLGMAEAGFFPGVVFYLSLWFPSGVRARAISNFYVSMPLASVVMGMLAGALLNLQGKLGLAGWQWLFLVEGLPAIVLSVAFLLWLPDRPETAAWLTTQERDWLAHQLRKDAHREVHHAGVGSALLDLRVWVMGLIFLCSLGCNYAYTFSAPAILQAVTGWNNSKVGYLIAAIGLGGALGMVLNARHSDHSGERRWHAAIPFMLMGAGFGVAGVSHAPALVVPALAVTALCFFTMQGPLWAIPGTFLQGRAGAAGIAAINMVGILGGFAGPYWMGLAKDFTGDYQRGLLTLALPSLAGAVMALLLRLRSQPLPN